LVKNGCIPGDPIRELVAAVSVGLVDGVACLDLDYVEDSSAQVDMNLVVTESGGLVEVQGTAEGHPFRRDQLDELLDLGMNGISTLVDVQRQVLGR
jgi:ribonuclease PH